MKNEQPIIKELQDRVVACTSFTGNYIENPKIFGTLYNQLTAWAEAKGLMSETTGFISSYANNPKNTPSDQLQLDVCMNISEHTEVDGEVKKKVLPGGEYAVMHAELESAEEYARAWEAIVEWVEKNHELDTSRPGYEIYLNNPEDHPQKHHILDICLSIK